MVPSKERELAYVVKIKDIKPIEGSDNCECAVVKGWEVMVRKNTFKVGEYAIYFEIDSLLPAREPFMFLEKKKFRIKIQKYTFGGKNPGFYSQGLLMPFSDFQKGETPLWLETLIFKALQGIDIEDTPVTKDLGVKYYIAEDNKRKARVDKYTAMMQRRPALFKKKWAKWLMNREWGAKLMFFIFGKKKDKLTAFPTKFPFVTKTDELRVERLPEILEDKTPYRETTKIDGTSLTVILENKGRFRKPELYVCSRNVRMLNAEQKCYHGTNVYWEAVNKFHLDKVLDTLMYKENLEYMAIQGEIAGCSDKDGTKIQGDPHKFGRLRFFAFNVIDSVNGRWDSCMARDMLNHYGVEFVPIVNENYVFPDTLEEFKKHADGPCEAPGASGLREGYVYRCSINPDKSIKNVSREYLLKH